MTTLSKPQVIGEGATGEVIVNAAKKYRAGTPGVNFHTGARQVTKKPLVETPKKHYNIWLVIAGVTLLILVTDVLAWFVVWSPLLTRLEHWW